MPALRDMALMVEERADKQFFWVLIEASDTADDAETMHYRRSTEASTPQSSYSSALALGAAALRQWAEANA